MTTLAATLLVGVVVYATVRWYHRPVYTRVDPVSVAIQDGELDGFIDDVLRQARGSQ